MTVSGGTTRLIQQKSFNNAGNFEILTRVELEQAILDNTGTLRLGNSVSQRGLEQFEVPVRTR